MIRYQAEMSLEAGRVWLRSVAGVILIVALIISSLHADDEPVPRETGSAKDAAAAKVESQELKARTYSGRVVDLETGAGVTDARVKIRKYLVTSDLEVTSQRTLEETTTTTDANGDYQFEIRPERHAELAPWIQIDVEHDGYASSKPLLVSFSAIQKGEAAGKSLAFERIPLRRGELVTGTIVDPDGQPVPDVVVRAYSLVGPVQGDDSFSSQAKTDAQGRFQLVVPKEGVVAIWVVPESFAMLEQYVGTQRGDLGEIRLMPGVRTSGRVIDFDGQPIAGVNVLLYSRGPRSVGNVQNLFVIHRSVVSDAEGRFSFAPLAPGEYQTRTTQSQSDPLIVERKRQQQNATFIPKRLRLSDNSASASFELQAHPSVKVHFRFRDCEGRGVSVSGAVIVGIFDTQVWSSVIHGNAAGDVTVTAPHGLQGARLRLPPNAEFAWRYRANPDEPLNGRFHRINLGSLNDDIERFEIIRYQSPVLRVSAVDEAQNPIENLKIKALYAMPMPKGYIIIQNGGDIRFESQDNKEYSSTQMLPDEEITLTVMAEGYSPLEVKVNLKEREVKDLKVTLSKSP